MQNDKILYIIAGANGSGKSTLANEILNNYNLDFVNADDIAKNLNPDNIDSVKIKAGKIAIKKIYNLLQNEKSFIIETTLSGNFLINIILQAKLKNYIINLIYVFLDNYNICINRVKTRVYNGGHNVPEQDIIRRYLRSKNNFFKYSNMVDKYELYYNGDEYLILIANNNNIYNHNLYKLFLKDTQYE